jgi:leucyl/phenylalanyl-tRNA--protein transferase
VPIYLLSSDLVFPTPEHAEAGGLLAVGGDLEPERLLLAYSMGIFPWYSEGEPILWYSPETRMVLRPEALHVSRSLARRLRGGTLRVTLDEEFGKVVRACAATPRPGQDGTWITRDMVNAYERLHALGHAHSVEVWEDDELVGGLYGLAVGSCFCGESMFSHRPDASKVGFVRLVSQLDAWGFRLVDCQLPTEHLERFGAESWPRSRFLRALADAVADSPRRGRWSFDAPAPDDA